MMRYLTSKSSRYVAGFEPGMPAAVSGPSVTEAGEVPTGPPWKPNAGGAPKLGSDGGEKPMKFGGGPVAELPGSGAVGMKKLGAAGGAPLCGTATGGAAAPPGCIPGLKVST
eukprot:scaffold468_cov216-Pinguiococcus_pyrenoidosus.AAC.4